MKQPNGTFDNTVTLRREIWRNGKLEISHSKDFVDSECSRSYSYSMNQPWGHFPDLTK